MGTQGLDPVTQGAVVPAYHYLGKRSADADAGLYVGAYGYAGFPFGYSYGVPFGSSTGLDPITQGLDAVTQGVALPYHAGVYGYGYYGKRDADALYGYYGYRPYGYRAYGYGYPYRYGYYGKRDADAEGR